MNRAKSLYQWGQHYLLKCKPSWFSQNSSIRNRAFADYTRSLLKILPGPPSTFRITAVDHLYQGKENHCVVKIRFLPKEPTNVNPGDLLYLRWKNRFEEVESVWPLLQPVQDEDQQFWTEGSAYAPARTICRSTRVLLEEELDLRSVSPGLLEKIKGPAKNRNGFDKDAVSLRSILDENANAIGSQEVLRRQTRVRPRLFTFSKVTEPESDEESSLELLVSVSGEVGGRASGFVRRLREEDEMTGWILPHPHRLPLDYGYRGPGLIVVSGTGIAAPLAYLRAGYSLADSHLIWGIRHRDLPQIDSGDLDRALGQKRLGRVTRVESLNGDGAYVQDVLAKNPDWLTEVNREGGWVYVSGHHAMAEDVERCFIRHPDLGESVIQDWKKSLRYVESASG